VTDPGLDATYLAVLTDVPDFSAHVPVVDVDDPARFVFLTDLIVERLLDDVGAGVLEPPTGEAG